MPLWEFLGVSGRVLVAIVVAVAVLCCSCGVIIVVCLYRRNRAVRQPHPHPQMSNYHYPAGPMVDAGGNFGTNGTFGTLMVEKPPPYPGAPQHTSIIPPGTYTLHLVNHNAILTSTLLHVFLL
ncbi:hypothetical protein Pmani_036226 [Petrolisthes manimaculis]|uniref:Uncharacterized protein n=1 Tax=Petrolisthes manimaculis TaxID=1843537 RepID=A0AAE1TMB5_9EUCA|nr:hypothetical protein Pmani_036226 [Petrolisthes manimaculis]